MSEFDKALENLGQEATEQQLRERLFAMKQVVEKSKRQTDAIGRELVETKTELSEAYTELELYKHEFSERPEWLTDEASTNGHRATLVAFFSDAHYGEVVRPEEIGGYNAYNMAIAEQRTRLFFDRTILLARTFLAGVTYDGLVLPLGGDLVSGDIHDELVETNEQSTLRTVEIILPWLAAGIEKLAEEFGKVHVVSAPGNHGRNSKRPRHKKRSENNADTHVAHLLATMLSDEDGITFNIPESADVDFDVYGLRFSMEHGDNLRFNGTSEIGSIGPVKRGNLRKTKKRQEQGSPFKYGLYGHFHQLMMLASQGFIVNGSLKGYDEYASDGQFTPEPAQQALLVCTPEHGITVSAPVLVSKRSEEGW